MYDFKDDIYYEVYEQQLFPTLREDKLLVERELFSEAYNHVMHLQEDLILEAQEMKTQEGRYWTYRKLYDKEGRLLGTITTEKGNALIDTGKILIFVHDKINDILIAYTIKEVNNG